MTDDNKKQITEAQTTKLDVKRYNFEKRPSYLQESTKTNGEAKHINTKVTAAFFDEWQAAKDAAEAYGFEVNTAALVRQALSDAIKEIAVFIEAQDRNPQS